MREGPESWPRGGLSNGWLYAVHETTSEHTDEILDFLERQSKDLQVIHRMESPLQS